MNAIGKLICGLVVGMTVGACGATSPSEVTESTESNLGTSVVSPVPSACVSGEDGPCGGFTTHPCTCAPGLICKPNRIPDLPGTCEPKACCPVGWNMYRCNEENGTTGLNCHNPKLACASSLTCGTGGCDFEVSGRCPVCDPIKCPVGERWDSTLCKCVPGCNTAADCSGLLPALCKVCDGGANGCAHWACIANKCEVAYCQ
jgi:hypothetical protein